MVCFPCARVRRTWHPCFVHYHHLLGVFPRSPLPGGGSSLSIAAHRDPSEVPSGLEAPPSQPCAGCGCLILPSCQPMATYPPWIIPLTHSPILSPFPYRLGEGTTRQEASLRPDSFAPPRGGMLPNPRAPILRSPYRCGGSWVYFFIFSRSDLTEGLRPHQTSGHKSRCALHRRKFCGTPWLHP